MISVIVPVYKVEAYLSRCVDSILKQTFTDFELVLVDDGSPDHCGDICESYSKKDTRIHVLHRKNGGLSAARNTGIDWVLAHSKSEWITFIDSDDWIHPRYLDLLYQAVQKTGLSIAIGRFERTDGTHSPLVNEAITATVWDTETFYCADKVTATVAWGKLYRKADFTAIRYPEGKIHEDEFTTYKILFLYDAVAVIEQPLYAYYQNNQGIMRSGWNPGHIAECDGMLLQTEFFLQEGYSYAAAYTARVYLNSIFRNASNARIGGGKYQVEHRALVKRLRLELKHYAPLAGMNLENANWLYYMAHPILTIPYRIFRRLLKK